MNKMIRVLVLILGLWMVMPSGVMGQDDAPVTEEGGGDEKEKKKKKKKKGDAEAGEDVKREAGDVGSDENGQPKVMVPAEVKDLVGGVNDTSRVTIPCMRYRSGYMEFIDKNYNGIKIKRKGKKEVWVNTIDGNKLTFKVEWVAHNHYVLTFVKGKQASRFKKGYILDCTMVNCWDEYYDCDCDLNGITQYASVLKTKTVQEIKAAEKAEQDKIAALEMAERKRVADSVARADALAKAAERKAAGEVVTEAPADGGAPPAPVEGEGDKKTSKEKEEKPPKEKKEKGAKKEKAPKEKKVKEPKKEKPPKEVKEGDEA